MMYVAFLLGINVGGRTVKMDRLKNVMEQAGYREVRTLLASGNVRFECDARDPDRVTEGLDRLLTERFGFTIRVIVRTVADLQKLMDQKPFEGIVVTPLTRRYVTFLGARPEGAHITSTHPDFKILSCTDHEVFSVLTLTEGSRTVDLMNDVVKCYGKYITTRNWNTIERLLTLE